MKIANVAWAGRTRMCAVVDNRAVDIGAVAAASGASAQGDRDGAFGDLAALLALGRDAGHRLAEVMETPAAGYDDISVPLEAADIRPPFVPTAKILCHVINYLAHGSEAQIDPPERPFFFLKPGSAVIGPRDPIPAYGGAAQLDYEVELAAVIGRPGRDISAETAYEHIAGYLVLNDISYRDLQFNTNAPSLTARYGQNWTQGKGLDGACPLGPWITLVDELPEPYPLSLRSWVDGELRQEAKTSEQIYKLPALIEDISRGMTLHPGDLIATGTPAGSGIADGAYLRPGQTVRCEIERLGALDNLVVPDDGYQGRA